jgi:transposase
MNRNVPEEPCARCKPLFDKMQRHIESLESQNRHLESRIRYLEALVEELRRGGKRQAAPFSQGPPKSEPKPPGRKPGDAYGFHARRPPPDRFDEVYEASLPNSCPHCQCRQIDETRIAEQYQVEVPRKPIRRKFLVHIGCCRRCGRRVQGRHPLQTSDALGAAASQLGSDAQALAVHLNKETGLSHGKVAHLFDRFFGVALSRGGSAQVILRAAHRAHPAYQDILFHVRRSRTVYPDETGWKVGGRLWWLWDFVTPDATAYLIRDSRGFDVPAEVLGADYDGIMVHDGWAPYDAFQKADHQMCLAHLLRRCRELLETAERGAARFPRAIKEILQKAIGLRDRRDEGDVSSRGLAVAIGRLEAQLDRLLIWPRKNDANERLAVHILRHRAGIFTFLRRSGVEATNWPAEQAIRPAVVNRKVWGGNRTPAGAYAQSVLASVLRTCAQQGRDAIDVLSQLLRAPLGNMPRLLSVPDSS